MVSKSALLALCSLLLAHSSLAATNDNVVNTKVDRTIDITSQLVKIATQVVVLNKAATPLKEYIVQFGDEAHDSSLSYLAVSVGKKSVKVAKVPAAKGDLFASYRVDLSSAPIESGKSAQLDIEAAFTRLLVAYPEEIVQADKQLIVYTDRVYLATPYTTETQSTRVKLPSSTGVESYSKVRPVTINDKIINYGPYDKIAPTVATAAATAEEELRVHVENNTPFLTTERLERSVQVSHWAGAVSIEEVLDVVHTGAKLKGAFSRFEYQREPSSNGLASIRGWKTKLPKNAEDIYYRDEIGNISTSNVRAALSGPTVEIRPRFPLFGGWKTQYILGYTLPAASNLFTVAGSSLASAEYVLRVPFVDHIYDNMAIDEARVKIILPEGASNIRLSLPYDIKREKDEVFYSYLDTIGRPVVVLSKQNLVDWHIQNVEVRYSYKPFYLLQEPLLVVGSIFALCLLVIGLVRTKTSLDGK